MRDMASPSPVHFSVQLPSTQKNSRTSLVNSVGGSQRSYGTVKESLSGISSPYNRSSLVEFLTHPVCPDDTLQGIALQYNVTIHAIQRLNNLWGSESVHSRLTLKIPLHHSNTSSRSETPSPTMAKRTDKRTENDQLTSSKDHLTNGKDESTPNNHHKSLVPEDEVVRSKLNPRRRYQSSTATCGADGVKSISDILNSADEQLKVSQRFAEKLAIRSAALSLPGDAYHRTPDEDNLNSADQSSFDDGSKRIYRRGEISPERMSVSREELENKLFEL